MDFFSSLFKYYNVKYEEDSECKAPPAEIMEKLHQTTKFSAMAVMPTTLEGHGTLHRWSGRKNARSWFTVKTTMITWSGTNFSGSGAGFDDKLTGHVCYSKGNVLVSFDYVNNDPKDTLRFSVRDAPCDPKLLMQPEGYNPSTLYYETFKAPEAKKYITLLDWKSPEDYTTRTGPPETWDATLVDVDWSGEGRLLVQCYSGEIYGGL